MSRCGSWSRTGYRSSFPNERRLVERLEILLLGSSGVFLSVFTLLNLGAAPIHASGFLTAPTYEVALGAGSTAVGDFNGDGIPDLAVVSVAAEGINAVSILLGNRDGTFQRARNYTAGFTIASIAVGDFNGDGKLDLAVANDDSAYQPGVSILLGNGDGTFQSAKSFAAGSNPFAVAVGDFDGDGFPDLAVVNNMNPTGMVTILLGNGNGTFHSNGVSYAVGSAPWAVAMRDFNGDGFPDLAVANVGDGTVSVLLGNGDGTF